jgi:hypothetical protein
MRRDKDFYETPPWMTRALLAQVPEISGTILEPCAGDMSIARILSAEGGLKVFTNDVDPLRPADSHYDAADPAFATLMAPFVDWVITNPPYEMPLCTNIVANAIRTARVGVAMMLRISFEEPTAKVNPRGPFLELNPLSRKLVMPRHSFTGDGKSDSATTAWMIWAKVPLTGHPMLSMYRADVRYSNGVGFYA